MARKRAPTTDALKIIDRRYFDGHPDRLRRIEEARLSFDIAQQLYDLRTEARLTQRQLAERAKTTASVICRLEDGDYDGHSLRLLQRVATALGAKVEVRIKPAKRRATKPEAAPRRRRAASA